MRPSKFAIVVSAMAGLTGLTGLTGLVPAQKSKPKELTQHDLNALEKARLKRERKAKNRLTSGKKPVE